MLPVLFNILPRYWKYMNRLDHFGFSFVFTFSISFSSILFFFSPPLLLLHHYDVNFQTTISQYSTFLLFLTLRINHNDIGIIQST